MREGVAGWIVEQCRPLRIDLFTARLSVGTPPSRKVTCALPFVALGFRGGRWGCGWGGVAGGGVQVAGALVAGWRAGGAGAVVAGAGRRLGCARGRRGGGCGLGGRTLLAGAAVRGNAALGCAGERRAG